MPGDETTWRLETRTVYFSIKTSTSDQRSILQQSSPCIDLLQPNLVTKSNIHSSLHSNCYHQITYAKFNFEMFYSPPHEQVVWNYQDAINDLIQKKSTYPHSNVKEIFLTRLSISKYQFLMKLFQLSGQVLFSRKPNFLGNDSRKKQYFSALHDKLK